MRLGKANTILISKSNATIAYISTKWINLLTHNNNVIYHDYKHNTSVKYQMYWVTVHCSTGVRATPLIRLSPCVSEAANGAGNDTPPFDTSMQPELGICLMSAIPDSNACAQTHSRPRRRHLTDPRCANKMRVDKVGVGLHDRNHIEITYKFNDQT